MNINAAPEIKEAIARVRNDNDETDFVSVTHADGKVDTLVLFSSGTGGVEALAATFDASKIVYGMVRIVDLVDGHATVKFVFVQCIGDAVKPMFRGRVGPYMGTITPLFEPHHVSFHVNDASEFTAEAVARKVGDASGSRDHTTVRTEGMQERGFTGGRGAVVASKNHLNAQDAAGSPSGAKSTPDAPGTPGSSSAGGVTASSTSAAAKSSPASAPQASRPALTVTDDIVEAIKSVRDDATPDVDWCLASGTATGIELSGKGSGGVASLRQAVEKLDGAVPSFGLVRLIDVVDGHPTVKFASVAVVPESLKPMDRARLTTRRGVISETFAPFHVEITVENAGEIDETHINELIGSASGSLSKVKETTAAAE